MELDQTNLYYLMYLKKHGSHNVTICQHRTIRPSEAGNTIMSEPDHQSLVERQSNPLRDGERSP